MERGADPMTGRVLEGRYRVGAKIARGGMATVYEAHDLRLNRGCAVKIMHSDLGDDADFRRRFVREAHAAARLSHPNVVSVSDQGDDDGALFLVMEHVEGRTLREVMREEAPMPPERALALLEPVLAALAEAHAAGLVHRDVKPENVLIADDGRIKVADFGLARAFDASVSQTATRGVLIGTVSYLAPELIVDGSADPRVDVYAAGVLLFEMLTGRKPHEGEGAIQIAFKHVNEDIAAPSTCTSQPLPSYVDALVTRATSREREHRQADAKVFLQQARRVARHAARGCRRGRGADRRPAAGRARLRRGGRETASTTSTRTPTAGRAPWPPGPRPPPPRRGRVDRRRRRTTSTTTPTTPTAVRTTTCRCPTARRPPPSSASAVSPEPVSPGRPGAAPLRSRSAGTLPSARAAAPPRPVVDRGARRAALRSRRGPSSHGARARRRTRERRGAPAQRRARPGRSPPAGVASPPAAAAAAPAPLAPWARAAARGRAADGGRGLRRLVVRDRALHLDARASSTSPSPTPSPRWPSDGLDLDVAERVFSETVPAGLDHRDRARGRLPHRRGRDRRGRGLQGTRALRRTGSGGQAARGRRGDPDRAEPDPGRADRSATARPSRRAA